MSIDDLRAEAEKMFHKRMELMKRKSEDYGTGDALSNFKRVGAAMEALRTKELPCELTFSFNMILLKLDRWINLILKETAPENEPVSDTIMDLFNYIELSATLSKEMDAHKLVEPR